MRRIEFFNCPYNDDWMLQPGASESMTIIFSSVLLGESGKITFLLNGSPSFIWYPSDFASVVGMIKLLQIPFQQEGIAA